MSGEPPRHMPGLRITSALCTDTDEAPVPVLTKFSLYERDWHGARVLVGGPRCCGKSTFVKRLLQTTRMQATVLEDVAGKDILGFFTAACSTSDGTAPALRVATTSNPNADLFSCTDIAIVFPTTSRSVLHNWRVRVFPCFKADNELALAFSVIAGMKYSALVIDFSAFAARHTPYLFYI